MRSILLLIIVSVALARTPGAQERISRPGEYRGYSEPVYDGWQRTAQYLTMRDGVRIAIDIFRPTKGGVVHSERLPVVWSHVRYHRGDIRNDTLVTFFTTFGRGADLLVKHGYVVAAVDTRGGGASFGTQQGFFHPDESRDAYEVTEWLAKQPWSTGRIGMIGRSYLGITQYFAASERPPHLVAIFPEMAVFEWYPFIYPGGIYRDDFFASWQKLTSTLDRSDTLSWFVRRLGPVAPVDGPAGRAQRDSAIVAHRASRDIFEMWAGVPFRNSVDPVSGKRLFAEREPAARLDAINRSGVAIYTLVGWYDAFPRDALLWFANLAVPQKLIIGPWFHGYTEGFDLGTERVRWFDHWLKQIDNGIMREPPVRYHVIDAPADSSWRTTRVWPIREAKPTTFYFAGGPSGSSKSRNDGILVARRSAGPAARDTQTVDQSATVGPGTRWANTYGGNVGYPDLAGNDAKGFTYTTAPLPRGVEVIGHPIVHLWVQSSANDADFFVYLEEVDSTGRSTYVTEGAFRASHRKLARPPFANFGLPWPRSYRTDVAPLPNPPAELVFDLHPTAKRFRAGSRIRITVTNADRDTHRQPYPASPPLVTLHRGGRHASRVILPVK